MSLTSDDFGVLEKAFEIPNDEFRVNYKAMIEDIETVFTTKVKKEKRFFNIFNLY